MRGEKKRDDIFIGQMTMMDDIYPEWKARKKTGNALFDTSSCEWETPDELYSKLNDEFHFTLDPCSTDENAKCEKHYTIADNGLVQDWTGETVFCNPPYGKDISAWCEKCYRHSVGGGTSVMLLPARTDTQWFHKWIYKKATIRFIEGRVKYGGSKWNAPFPSMIVIFRGRKKKGRENKPDEDR